MAPTEDTRQFNHPGGGWLPATVGNQNLNGHLGNGIHGPYYASDRSGFVSAPL